MNGIIIYKGKYGATEQYATWLAEALKLSMVKTDVATPGILSKYDTVILGSSIYVGQLLISKWLKQHSRLLSEKKLFLFIVSGSTTEDKALQQQVLEKIWTLCFARWLRCFFFPAGAKNRPCHGRTASY